MAADLSRVAAATRTGAAAADSDRRLHGGSDRSKRRRLGDRGVRLELPCAGDWLWAADAAVQERCVPASAGVGRNGGAVARSTGTRAGSGNRYADPHPTILALGIVYLMTTKPPLVPSLGGAGGARLGSACIVAAPAWSKKRRKDRRLQKLPQDTNIPKLRRIRKNRKTARRSLPPLFSRRFCHSAYARSNSRTSASFTPVSSSDFSAQIAAPSPFRSLRAVQRDAALRHLHVRVTIGLQLVLHGFAWPENRRVQFVVLPNLHRTIAAIRRNHQPQLAALVRSPRNASGRTAGLWPLRSGNIQI